MSQVTGDTLHVMLDTGHVKSDKGFFDTYFILIVLVLSCIGATIRTY